MFSLEKYLFKSLLVSLNQISSLALLLPSGAHTYLDINTTDQTSTVSTPLNELPLNSADHFLCCAEAAVMPIPLLCFVT